MSKNLIIFCILTIIIVMPLPISAEDYQIIVSKSNKVSAVPLLKSKLNYFQKYNLYNIMKREIIDGLL